MALVEGAPLAVLACQPDSIVPSVQAKRRVRGEVVCRVDACRLHTPPESQGAKSQSFGHGKVHSTRFVLAHLPGKTNAVSLPVLCVSYSMVSYMKVQTLHICKRSQSTGHADSQLPVQLLP